MHYNRTLKSSMQHLYYEISLRHAVLDSAEDKKAALREIVKLNRRFFALVKKFKLAFLTEGTRFPDKPNLKNHPLQWRLS